MGFSFILLAGGTSSRFKSGLPKQYHKIAGKTLIEISIDKIKKFKEIKKIIVVYNKSHKKYLKNINNKNITLIEGGNTRSRSTYNALCYLKKKTKINRVLIHDAARPNFSKKLINTIFTASKKNKTIIPVLKIQDALKENKAKGKILHLKRNNFFLTQTPQCFILNEIFLLHKEFKNRYNDDDFSLIKKTNNVKLINSEKRNFKITNKEDLNLLERFYKSNLKVGIGFDVHRLVKGEKLFLGGVKIPSKLGTLGHSDGDPVLHAVIDAILGACSKGDIGERFSNKDKKFKNISSSILVKEVIKEIRIKNYGINNIDINIITESPRLEKHKKKILKNISFLCEILENKINIKAKTTEKLGVIGHEKAIAAEVIVSIAKYD